MAAGAFDGPGVIPPAAGAFAPAVLWPFGGLLGTTGPKVFDGVFCSAAGAFDSEAPGAAVSGACAPPATPLGATLDTVGWSAQSSSDDGSTMTSTSVINASTLPSPTHSSDFVFSANSPRHLGVLCADQLPHHRHVDVITAFLIRGGTPAAVM
jgi:hypothetical protein